VTAGPERAVPYQPSKKRRAEIYINKLELYRDRVPSFDEYPFNLPAIRSLKKLEFTHPLTFFIGENGSGKSTLTEAIAISAGFNSEGGRPASLWARNKCSHNKYPDEPDHKVSENLRRFLRIQTVFDRAVANPVFKCDYTCNE